MKPNSFEKSQRRQPEAIKSLHDPGPALVAGDRRCSSDRPAPNFAAPARRSKLDPEADRRSRAASCAIVDTLSGLVDIEVVCRVVRAVITSTRAHRAHPLQSLYRPPKALAGEVRQALSHVVDALQPHPDLASPAAELHALAWVVLRGAQACRAAVCKCRPPGGTGHVVVLRAVVACRKTPARPVGARCGLQPLPASGLCKSQALVAFLIAWIYGTRKKRSELKMMLLVLLLNVRLNMRNESDTQQLFCVMGRFQTMQMLRPLS